MFVFVYFYTFMKGKAMFKIFDKEIDLLLSEMTLREKLGQLNQPETPRAENVEEIKSQIRRGEIGSILMSVGATAGNDAQGAIDIDFYNELQRIAVEESPKGIPLIFGRDVIHGHRVAYPIPLAMAASFNYPLIEQCYRDIAVEASNDSVHWSFAPMLDLCHDARWGRIIEGAGEDSFIGANMARAVVRGFQGENLANSDSIAACAKHFIGYGAAEGGRDYHHTEISDYNLYNNYLPAFRAAVDEGVATVMSSFNDINGQPVTSSKFHLTDVLRGKLDFEGFVVSDYAAVKQLIHNGVAENEGEAATLAINAGVDMDMWDYCYLNELEKAVADGTVSIEKIDEAVRRVLRVKFAKGLFQKPYCAPAEYDIEAHRKNARKLAAESMVLLKNENNALPLSKNSHVSLEGPFKSERRALLGSWTLDAKEDETPTLLEEMRKKVKGTGDVYTSRRSSELYDNSIWIMNRSQAIVLALGESHNTTGENRNSSMITLSDTQKQIIANAKALKKKVIGVFFCGRPLAMQGIAEDFDAILYAWHSGTETAGAVADILYGDTVPSGRLPVTMPRLVGHIPLYYNCLSSGHDVNSYYGENPDVCYVDSVATPYYPFGFGLSYTTFDYSDIACENSEISLEDIKNGKQFKFSVTVKNTGDFDSFETVQLYIRDVVAQICRPLRELKAFEKVFINKGKQKDITLTLGYKDLGYYTSQGEFTVEKGKFEIHIGENALTKRKLTVNII